MPDRPKDDSDQETRNDDPNVQDQREQRATGERDRAEGERIPARGGSERVNPATEDERVNAEVSPHGDRKHNAREARRPGGGRKGMPADGDAR